MKNNIKLKTAVALGVMGLLSKIDNPLEVAKKHLQAPMSQEDKWRAQGLKPYEFHSGVIVWAINSKNATKKYFKRHRNE